MTRLEFAQRCGFVVCCTLAAGAAGCSNSAPAGQESGASVELPADPLELPADAARGVRLIDETVDR